MVWTYSGALRVLTILLVCLSGTARTHGDMPAPVEIDAGPLQLTVYIAPTANVFHVVDQLAEWSPYCHRQYGRNWGELSERDRELLKEHAAIRSRRGWGGGLEQTFYTPLDIGEAVERGVAEGWITAQEGEIERRVLEHFAPAVEGMASAEREYVLRFRQRLVEDTGRIREFAVKAGRFCDVARVEVPVYLLANPDDHNFGGGYNGGRLTVEVPRKDDAYPTFLHEVFHAFINQHEAKLTAAIRGVEGLDYQTLNEGLAHAFAPGILRPSDATDDLLARLVREHVEEGLTLADAHARFHRYALALRPLLREALEDEKQTLESFLPRAIDGWRIVRELDSAVLTATLGEKSKDTAP